MRMAPSARNDSEAEIVLQRSLTALITLKKHHKEQAHAPTTKKTGYHIVLWDIIYYFFIGEGGRSQILFGFQQNTKKKSIKGQERIQQMI